MWQRKSFPFTENTLPPLKRLKYIFAPELIALSGGITKEGDTLMEFVIPHLLDPERVKISSLGGDAGIVGASFI